MQSITCIPFDIVNAIADQASLFSSTCHKIKVGFHLSSLAMI